MTLAESLPDRPLAFAETCRSDAINGVEHISPLDATVDRSVMTSEEATVVASLVLEDDRGAFAGFDPTMSSWAEVAFYPAITA